MQDSANSTMLFKIEALYGTFSVSYKKIADWILENRRLLLRVTISQLAEQCGVSDATVVRFSRMLGYRGFQDLRLSFAQEFPSQISILHEGLDKSDSNATIYEKVCDSVMQALDDTQKVLDTNQVDKAISSIKNAGRILIIGMGSSAVIGGDLQHKLIRLGYFCHFTEDHHMQMVSIANFQKGDLLIAISHSGESKDVNAVMQLAQQKGVTTMAITSYGKTSILKHTDIPLFVASREMDFHMLPLASRISQLCVVDLLYLSLAMQDGEKSIKQVNSLETMLKASKNGKGKKWATGQ